MKTFGCILVSIPILIVRFIIDVVSVIIHTHRMMPWPVVVFSVLFNVLMITFTHWYPLLLVYWYSFSCIAYIISPKYRTLFTLVLKEYNHA